MERAWIEQCRQDYLQRLEGSLSGRSRAVPDQYLKGLLSLVLSSHLPQPLVDSVFLLTRLVYTRLEDGPARVVWDPQSSLIRLEIDLRWLDPLASVLQRYPDQLATELAHIAHHELAHILLGHLDGPDWEYTDPMMVLAKEIAVNDGWLRLGDTVLPAVKLDQFEFGERVLEYARTHQYPDDWLQRHLLVYRALVACAGNVGTVRKGELAELVRRWGLESLPIRDHAPSVPDHVEVLVVADSNAVSVYPLPRSVVAPGGSGQAGVLDAIRDTVLPELLGSGLYQYDQIERQFRYSPSGFAKSERNIRPTTYRVQWHRIRRILGVRYGLGYHRRLGHLYPPDESPLVATVRARKTVTVFYDSSASVPDEVLSRFVGTMRRSPFRIEEHYFSTEVTDEPHTGGTRFRCIEEFLLQRESYPDVVIVLTDGQDYGEPFTPAYPERWYWIVYGDPQVPRRIGGEVIEVTIDDAID